MDFLGGGGKWIMGGGGCPRPPLPTPMNCENSYHLPVLVVSDVTD